MKYSIFFGALMVFVLAGCQTPPALPPAPDAAVLGDHDNGQTVVVSRNATITATLTANPTTGYQWTMPTAPNPQVVQLVTSTFHPPDPGMPGAGGTQSWVFKTVGPGSAVVQLAYGPPPTPPTPATYFTFTVVAQ